MLGIAIITFFKAASTSSVSLSMATSRSASAFTCAFTCSASSFFPSFFSGYADIPLLSWIVWGCSLLLFVGSLGFVMYRYGRYKIRTRLFLAFLLWWVFAVSLLWVVVPSSGGLLLPLLSASVGVLAGHLFSTSFTRASNISFLVVLWCLIGLSVYSCVWMYW